MFGGPGRDDIFGGLGNSDDGFGGPGVFDFCDATTDNQVSC